MRLITNVNTLQNFGALFDECHVVWTPANGNKLYIRKHNPSA